MARTTLDINKANVVRALYLYTSYVQQKIFQSKE